MELWAHRLSGLGVCPHRVTRAAFVTRALRCRVHLETGPGPPTHCCCQGAQALEFCHSQDCFPSPSRLCPFLSQGRVWQAPLPCSSSRLTRPRNRDSSENLPSRALPSAIWCYQLCAPISKCHGQRQRQRERERAREEECHTCTGQHQGTA